MKKFLILGLLWASAAFGQVFTTLYLPTAGSGLTLNIAAGRAFCGGSVVTYAGGTLTMAASVTNRVYLNTASSCAPAVKSTAFTSSDIPVATVVTSGSAITGLTDARTMFSQPPSGFSNPMTTLGDFIVGGSSGTPQRLGVGTDGQVVTADHTATNGVKWGTPASSGVQYDPSNTNYVFTGTSFWVDDTRILGQVINVTSGTCTGTTCSIVNSGNNKFSAGDWVIVSSMTGWISAPAPYGNGSWNNSGYSDIVQVSGTGLSATTFQFTSPVTATITGGSVENANQFAPMQFSRLPFANGHGTILGIFGANHQCADVNTNYTAMFHSYSPAVTGNPGYFILNGCGNDIGAGDSVATVEARLQSIWQKAHTDGWVVVMGNMIIGNPGALVSGGDTFKLSQLNDWIEGQGPRFDTQTPYCSTSCGMYWDRALDFHSAMPNVNAPNMFASNGGLGTGGAVAAANILNESLANKATSFKTQLPAVYFGWYGNTLPFNVGPGYIFSGQGVLDAFVITDSTQTNTAFEADTRTSSGNIPGIRVPQIQVSGVATSPSTAPICPNGTGGRFTTTGCTSNGLNDPGSNGVLKRTALNTTAVATVTDIVALWASGACSSGYLKFDGTCSTPSSVNVTTKGDLQGFTTVAARVPVGADGTVLQSDSTQAAGLGYSSAFKLPETTSPTAASTYDLLWPDSTAHRLKMNPNNVGNLLLVGTAAARTAGNCVSWAANGIDLVDAGGACGVSGGGVTAFNGDGVLLNNSGSIGAVTASLANAAAHKFFGNNTGSSAAPGYQTVGPADMTAQAADTVVMNATGGSAYPAAVSMPTCTTGADLYNTSTHTWTCVSTSGALPAQVQYTYVAENASVLASITSPSITVTSGNMVVVACRYGSSSASGSVASGASVTSWNTATAFSNASTGLQLNWGVVTSSGATTFTCTPNVSIANQSMTVMEISGGLGTANGNAGGQNSSTSSFGPWAYAQFSSYSPTVSRTFSVMCSTMASTSLNPLQVNLNGTWATVTAKSNAVASAPDTGCALVVFPMAPSSGTAVYIWISGGVASSMSNINFNY